MNNEWERKWEKERKSNGVLVKGIDTTKKRWNLSSASHSCRLHSIDRTVQVFSTRSNHRICHVSVWSCLEIPKQRARRQHWKHWINKNLILTINGSLDRFQGFIAFKRKVTVKATNQSMRLNSQQVNKAAASHSLIYARLVYWFSSLERAKTDFFWWFLPASCSLPLFDLFALFPASH